MRKIHKPTLSNSKWASSKLKEGREIEKYNNSIKQKLNYTQTDITDTNQQRGK
jgi:hypothetical protein